MPTRVTESRRGVLFVGNYLDAATGSRAVSEDLALGLERIGWPVLLTSRVQRKLPRLFDMIRTVWQRQDEYSVAVIDVYSGPAFIFAEAVSGLLRFIGKPYVLTLHGGNLPAFARNSPGRVRRLLRSAEVVTTPSRYLAHELRAWRDDLRVEPNPITVSKYAFRLRGQVRPSLIWLRAFHRLYAPEVAVRAASLVLKTVPGLTLTMAGPDKGDGSLSRVLELAASLGISHAVRCIGPVEKAHVPDVLQHGDIFLNTATIDNTPVSVLEAMACGLCVISSDVGGIPYLLEDGVDALLTPVSDPLPLAHAIQRVIADPELSARLSRKARAKAETFDWDRILPEWNSLLSQFCGTTSTTELRGAAANVN